MRYLDLEEIFFASLITFFTVLWIYLIVLWASPKHVHSYSLASGGGDALEIRVDIENSADDTIPLIGVDYERAVKLVDSLNQTIKNK